jgi:hypothetical protein
MRRTSTSSKVSRDGLAVSVRWPADTHSPGSIPKSIEEETPPAFKKSKHQYTHHMLDTPADEGSGGKARIVDSKNFPISKTIAAGHLDIEPGAMREMHWHPNADEWYVELARYLLPRGTSDTDMLGTGLSSSKVAHASPSSPPRVMRAHSITWQAMLASCLATWATSSRTSATTSL